MRYYNPQDIQGWMLEDSLEWLYERACGARLIIEVGCWYGRSTAALLNGMPDFGRLVAVDPWQDGGEYVDAEKAYHNFKSLFKRDIDNGRLIVMRMESRAAFEMLAEDTFDFVFIDGDHSYETVYQDIRHGMLALMEGGIISGHDYDTEAGVTEAVDEALRGFRRGPDSIWYRRL